MEGGTTLTVKELYYETILTGRILLAYKCIDVYGDEIRQEKLYDCDSDLINDFNYIGDYKITHIQALTGILELTIENP